METCTISSRSPQSGCNNTALTQYKLIPLASTQIYLTLAITFHLLFWLVPSFLASAVFVSLLGLCLAPLFPGAIVAATALLPKHLHVSAIGFAAAVGGGGAAVFPFAVGAIAQKAGVQVLMPIVVALLVVDLGLWLGLPRKGGTRRAEGEEGLSEEERGGKWRKRLGVEGLMKRRRPRDEQQ